MKTLQHRFVVSVPEEMEEGVLYISIEHCTAIHLCVCGCRNEVVTPLSPADWQLTFDGNSVSLRPSIGNWFFPCKSHYWIEKNQVKHARTWSRIEIERGRYRDKKLKDDYLNDKPEPH